MNYTTEIAEDNKLIVSFPDTNGILIWNGSLNSFQKALLENELKPSGKVTKSGKTYYNLVTYVRDNIKILKKEIEEKKSIITPEVKTNSDNKIINYTSEYNGNFSVECDDDNKPVKVTGDNNEKNGSVEILNKIIERKDYKSFFETVTAFELVEITDAYEEPKVETKQETTYISEKKIEEKEDFKKNKSNNLTVDFFNNIPSDFKVENKNYIPDIILAHKNKLNNDFKIENKKDFSGGRTFFSINGIIDLIEMNNKDDDDFFNPNKLVITHFEDKNSQFYMSDLRKFVQNEKLQVGDFVAVDFYINCVKSSKSIWFNNFIIKSIKKH